MTRGRPAPPDRPQAPTPVEAARISDRASALRARAERIRAEAELNISALLTAAQELEALLTPEPEPAPEADT